MPRALFCILISLLPLPAMAGDGTASPHFQHAYLLHLPGVGGELSIDHNLIHGLVAGGYDGHHEIYDWTEHDPGLSALWSRHRNDKEAQKVADKIQQIVKDDPNARITLTAHSGGNGIAVWALEKLPDDVKVQAMVMLASALSPQYDLSAALRHVRGKVYVFHSEYDSVVLGAGTRAFGTIDGVRDDASGRIGFTMPAAGDADQYAKLKQYPFDKSWMRLGNLGDHIGTLEPRFAEKILAPLILEELGVPTTQPAATQPAADK
jgi:pimeloyl-ACP methyl ester carboxylesterase